MLQDVVFFPDLWGLDNTKQSTYYTCIKTNNIKVHVAMKDGHLMMLLHTYYSRFPRCPEIIVSPSVSSFLRHSSVLPEFYRISL